MFCNGKCQSRRILYRENNRRLYSRYCANLLSDTEITEYFNERAFINCYAYSTIDEVINKIIEIDNNDEEYLAMLEEPIFSNDFFPLSNRTFGWKTGLFQFLNGNMRLGENESGR